MYYNIIVLLWAYVFKNAHLGGVIEMGNSEKIWLSSPTMHGEEQIFVKEAFEHTSIFLRSNRILGFSPFAF